MSSGVTIGPKRSTTLPSASIRNFSKFQEMSAPPVCSRSQA
jgi:hypothetical protein